MDTKAFARDIAQSSQDIRDVLQVLNVVMARPCVNKSAAGNMNRGTIIAYAEIQRIRKLLTGVLGVIEPRPEAR